MFLIIQQDKLAISPGRHNLKQTLSPRLFPVVV